MLNGARGPVRATGPAWWILGRDDLTMPPWLNTAPDIVINLRLVTAQQGPTASVWEDIRATTLHAVPLGRLNDVTRGCRAGRQTVSALANLAGHLAGIAGAATTTQAGESEQWREHAREELSTAVESWISRGAAPADWEPAVRPDVIKIFDWIAHSSPPTLRRRDVNGVAMDHGKAVAYFHASLRRATELATEASA